jgi:hypothetical protein
MDWRQYQRVAADFFADLGMRAEVEADVAGARASHRVDVAVRFTAYGLDHTWLVECKLWRSKIRKEKVMALKAIVDDVGADRGFLLSESGFQSGAITAARLSNITLTNLEDLRANAEADVHEIRCQELYSRMAVARAAFGELTVVTQRGETFATSRLKPGVESEDFWIHSANLHLIQGGLEDARLGRSRLAYSYKRPGDQLLIADGLEQFLDRASGALDEIQAWLREQISKPWRNKPKPAPGSSPPGTLSVTVPEGD